MKAELEQHDIEAIVDKVIERLKPILTSKNEDKDAIFDIDALSEYLRVSKKWIYERTHLKEIPYLKVNGLLRFRKKDIDKWLNSYNVPAVSTPERVLKAIR
ncbi:MAG: helix-turn-helix domain-containing protein [Thermodesulfovibrionales bacterium]